MANHKRYSDGQPIVKSSQPANKKQGDFQVTFVSIPLSEVQKRHMLSMNVGAAELMSSFIRLSEQGYKVSLSPDGAHSSFIATAIGKEADCPNQGKGMTGRGPDAIEAIRCMLYKHYEICGGEAWTAPDGDDMSGYG